ncbi:hypothetical protein E4T50_08151 [Aureobasidium sp. EXF-12298]|nr:hypothetical protein E4T50_08151 [Aureobasidium sp. EXF-12298]
MAGEEDSEVDIEPTPFTSPHTMSGEGLILGQPIVRLSNQHPSASCVIWLWKTYLENVNPILKMLHIPTVQPLIFDAASENMKQLRSNKEALLFSICLIALSSVPQCNQAEAERIMGQPVSQLIDVYTGLAQQALVNARFLQTPNFITLQALTLFLAAQRSKADPQTLWQLTGVAIRSAQQLGYHRERALRSPSVSVFQAELCRRLWWELAHLESFAAKQCGVTSIVFSRGFWDTNRPLNINDSDLHPEQTSLQREALGITEMSFCSARFEVGELTMAYSNPDTSSQDLSQVDAVVDELQQRLENRLLKYCDPSIPMHRMLQMFGRSAVARIKLTVRRRSMYATSGLSLEERNETFLLCLQLAEAPNSFAKDKTIQRFLWQANAFFPLDAFMFMLGELAYRPAEQPLPVAIETVWSEIEKAYESQPRLLYDKSNVIYNAVRNLTLKAWAKSTDGLSLQQAVPQFIQSLQSRLSTVVAPKAVVNAASESTIPEDNIGTNSFDGSDFDLDPSWSKIAIPDDPEFWEYWQQFAADVPEFPIT